MIFAMCNLHIYLCRRNYIQVSFNKLKKNPTKELTTGGKGDNIIKSQKEASEQKAKKGLTKE